LLVRSFAYRNWHKNAPSVVDELHTHTQIIIRLPSHTFS
jgi:hypothetical protein